MKNIRKNLNTISLFFILAFGKSIKAEHPKDKAQSKQRVIAQGNSLTEENIENFIKKLKVSNEKLTSKIKNLTRGSTEATKEAEKLFPLLEVVCHPNVFKSKLSDTFFEELVKTLAYASMLDSSFYALELCQTLFKTHSESYLKASKKLPKELLNELAEDVVNFHREQKEGNGG